MKKITKITITQVFLFVLLLIFAYHGFCEDSVSINVGCTIPAIPGVNAPLLETNTQIAQSKIQGYTLQNDQQGANKEQLMPLIQEDAQTENTTQEENNLTMLVKTFYPR